MLDRNLSVINLTKRKVFEGNSNAIFGSEPKIKMRSIHFDTKLALATECYKDGVYDIAPVESVSNVTDLTTKVLGKELLFAFTKVNAKHFGPMTIQGEYLWESPLPPTNDQGQETCREDAA